ncbi:MAG: hypothetical protein RL329_1581 [Bacteroidota bacterium]|jgi:hypothetical protein
MKSVLKKYLNDELTPIRAERLEQQMLTQLLDKKQKQRWEQLLSEEGIERHSLPSNNADIVKTAPKTATIVALNPRPMLWKRTAQAAVGAFLVLGSWFLMRPASNQHQNQGSSIDQYALEMQQTIQTPETRMGNANPADAVWKNAKAAYDAKAYEQAGDLLEGLSKSGKASAENQYYLGLARFFQTKPNYDAAITAFLASKQAGWVGEDEITWLLSLAYAKKGDNVNAQKALEILVQKNGYKAKEARLLLKK